MRPRWFALTLGLLAAATSARAQVGVAFRVRQGAAGIAVGVPIIVARGRLMVEPTLEFDRRHFTSQEDSVSFLPASRIEGSATLWSAGVGAFLRLRGSSVTACLGPRAGFTRRSTHVDTRALVANDVVSSGAWYAAVVGAETLVTSRLGLGAEAEWYR